MSLLRSQLCLAILATAGLAACGAARNATADLTGEKLSDANAEGLDQIRLVEGEFEYTNNKLCLGLRTKVFATRESLKLGAEWRALTHTDQYKAFSEVFDAYKELECDADANATAQACKDKRLDLGRELSHLRDTPQWQSLGNNDSWTSLQDQYADGAGQDCFTGLTLPQMKNKAFEG